MHHADVVPLRAHGLASASGNLAVGLDQVRLASDDQRVGFAPQVQLGDACRARAQPGDSRRRSQLFDHRVEHPEQIDTGASCARAGTTTASSALDRHIATRPVPCPAAGSRGARARRQHEPRSRPSGSRRRRTPSTRSRRARGRPRAGSPARTASRNSDPASRRLSSRRGAARRRAVPPLCSANSTGCHARSRDGGPDSAPSTITRALIVVPSLAIAVGSGPRSRDRHGSPRSKIGRAGLASRIGRQVAMDAKHRQAKRYRSIASCSRACREQIDSLVGGRSAAKSPRRPAEDRSIGKLVRGPGAVRSARLSSIELGEDLAAWRQRIRARANHPGAVRRRPACKPVLEDPWRRPRPWQFGGQPRAARVRLGGQPSIPFVDGAIAASSLSTISPGRWPSASAAIVEIKRCCSVGQPGRRRLRPTRRIDHRGSRACLREDQELQYADLLPDTASRMNAGALGDVGRVAICERNSVFHDMDIGQPCQHAGREALAAA